MLHYLRCLGTSVNITSTPINRELFLVRKYTKILGACMAKNEENIRQAANSQNEVYK